MTNDKTSCRQFDFVKELEKDVDGDWSQATKPKSIIEKCPHIKVNIFRTVVDALVDTGSQVTCISEALYVKIKNGIAIKELPVSNIQIMSAVTKKCTAVKKQVLLEMSIDGVKINYVFLIIPYLTSEMILGNNWLQDQKAVVNYFTNTIQLWGRDLGVGTVSFGRALSRGRLFPSNESNSHIQTVNQITNEDLLKSHHSTLSECYNVDLLNQEWGDKLSGKSQVQNQSSVDEVNCATKGLNHVNSRLNNRVKINDNSDEVSHNHLQFDSNNDKNKVIINGILFDKNNDIDICPVREDIYGENLYLNVLFDEFNSKEDLICARVNMLNLKSNYCEICYDDEIWDDNLCFNCSVFTLNNLNEHNDQVCEGLPEFDDSVAWGDTARAIAQTLTSLSPAQSDLLLNLITRYKRLFSEKPGLTGIYEHHIKLKNNKAYIKRNYPVPFAMRDSVRKEIQRMIDLGVVELSTSEYLNPLRIVIKKDGTVRCCLDARFLNELIEGDNESPPLINEIMHQYHNKNYLTTLDLTAGYWQVPLAKDSRPYTAFLFDGKLYQFTRIPFGLKTAGSGFMKAIRMALGNNCHQFLTSYVDDLLIATGSFEEHLQSLEFVFNRLLQHNFTLRIEKARFCQPEVSFLGYLLSPYGIKPDTDKLDKILKFEEPKNLVELQRIIGLCNYYRQFSLNHAKYLDPFRKLLSKKHTWEWNDYYSRAYKELKENFVKVIHLSHYDLDRPFYVQTDGSNTGICGVLYQIDNDGNHRVITIVSRCLIQAEKNYTTTEIELLAIVYAVVKFRVYLMGRRFNIVTDHQALVFLNKTQFLGARLSRWSLLLQEYDFQITHCTGKENIVADFFSRYPEGKFIEQTDEQLMLSTLSCYDTETSINYCNDALIIICQIELEPGIFAKFKEIAK